MKLKKLLLTTLISSSMFAVGCTGITFGVSGNAGENVCENNDNIINLDQSRYAAKTSAGLGTEPGDEIVNQIIDSLISKGSDLIVDGLQTYGKTVVLNLLKECGFDFRDATTKTLEKIQEQLNVIEYKINAMTKRQEQIHSEDVFGKLLKQINDTQNDYLTYVVDGLGYLAGLENDPTKDEKELEAARKDYYNNTIADLTIDGKPIATFVSNLADYIMLPNAADQAKTIFDYYDDTIGVYDVWSTLKVKNLKSFMAYVESTLVACANLAKFQIYYKALGMDEATINTYKGMMSKMVNKVNSVNALMKAKLDSLKQLEDMRDDGIVIYLPTGKQYSRRMATLTFDVNDYDEYGDSRQGLLMDYYFNSDGTRGEAYKFAMELVPDQDFLGKVANDFKTYANAFCPSTYTIKDYLKYIGFYSNNEELFNKSIGLYNANIYADGAGFLNEDYTYTTTYFNERGEYTRRNIYKVDSYHNWNWNVTRTTFAQLDDNYYLCFATPDGDRQKLDGKYERVYMKDCMSTVVNKVFYKKCVYDILRTNKTGWYLHDSW